MHDMHALDLEDEVFIFYCKVFFCAGVLPPE